MGWSVPDSDTVGSDAVEMHVECSVSTYRQGGLRREPRALRVGSLRTER